MELFGESSARWKPASANPRFAAVFVHGWHGHFLDTWRHSRRVFWRKAGLIDILARDASLPWQFFAVGHSARTFDPATLRDVAGTVSTFLRRFDDDDSVAGIALIAHSLGGLACRRAIIDEIDRSTRHNLRIFGLLMFGTPNDGTGLAHAAGVYSPSAREMKTYSEALRSLNSEWLEHVVNGGNPSRPLDERAPVLCRNIVGSSDWVVPAASADHLALLGDVRTLSRDHRGLPKPKNDKDDSVTETRQFLRDVEKEWRNSRQAIACDAIAAEARKRAADAPWVSTQKETITLTATDPATPRIVNCTIETVLTDVECRDVLNVGLRHQSADYAEDAVIDVDLLVGQGVLGNELDDAFRDGRVTVDALSDYARVDSISVTHEGKTFSYAAEPAVAGHASFILPFRCADFSADGQRVERLEMKITRVADLAASWWTFISEVTATERTEVNFRCPFVTTCLLHPPLRGNAKLRENEKLGGLLSNQVVVQGAVAAGTRIIWVWEVNRGV